MRPGYFHGAVNKLNWNVAKSVSQATQEKYARNSMLRLHIVTRYGCLNPTDLVTHVAIGLCVQTLYRVQKLLKVYILQVVYFVYLFAYSMTNIKRLMYCTPKCLTTHVHFTVTIQLIIT